jgi:hypothetical protein
MTNINNENNNNMTQGELDDTSHAGKCKRQKTKQALVEQYSYSIAHV